MARVLFIGLGSMGSPMACRLLEAGHDVTVVDLDDAKVASLSARGAIAAPNPRVGTSNAEVICTLVPADQHLHQVAFGENGFLANMSPGTTVVDFSTVSPQSFEEVALAAEHRGGAAFDAAVGPGPAAAAAGTLTIMVGGDEELVSRHRDVLDAVGNQVVHCGTRGSAKAVKIANNLVSAVTMLMNTEAMLLAVKAGADPRKLVDVMQGTIADNRIASTVFPSQVFTREFGFGFTVELMRKDVALAESMATETGVPFSFGRLALDTFTTVCESGGEVDVLRVVELLEAGAGAVLETPTPPPSS